MGDTIIKRERGEKERGEREREREGGGRRKEEMFSFNSTTWLHGNIPGLLAMTRGQP